MSSGSDNLLLFFPYLVRGKLFLIRKNMATGSGQWLLDKKEQLPLVVELSVSLLVSMKIFSF